MHSNFKPLWKKEEEGVVHTRFWNDVGLNVDVTFRMSPTTYYKVKFVKRNIKNNEVQDSSMTAVVCALYQETTELAD